MRWEESGEEFAAERNFQSEGGGQWERSGHVLEKASDGEVAVHGEL